MNVEALGDAVDWWAPIGNINATQKRVSAYKEELTSFVLQSKGPKNGNDE